MKLLRYTVLAGAVFFLFSCRTVDLSKRFPNMVANVDPVSVGTVEVQFEKAFSSQLNKVEVEVVFHPRLNAVSLNFRYELLHYRQFWDQAGRRQFAVALDRYKADYESRKLINKYNRTSSVYGKVTGRAEWEASKLTQTRVSYPVIGIGYRFRNDSPFFATLMQAAREVDEINNTSDNASRVDSHRINMYFTRAQADELVKLFDQAYLMGFLGGQGKLKSTEEIEMDSYREGDEPPVSSDEDESFISPDD